LPDGGHGGHGGPRPRRDLVARAGGEGRAATRTKIKKKGRGGRAAQREIGPPRRRAPRPAAPPSTCAAVRRGDAAAAGAPRRHPNQGSETGDRRRRRRRRQRARGAGCGRLRHRRTHAAGGGGAGGGAPPPAVATRRARPPRGWSSQRRGARADRRCKRLSNGKPAKKPCLATGKETAMRRSICSRSRADHMVILCRNVDNLPRGSPPCRCQALMSATARINRFMEKLETCLDQGASIMTLNTRMSTTVSPNRRNYSTATPAAEAAFHLLLATTHSTCIDVAKGSFVVGCHRHRLHRTMRWCRLAPLSPSLSRLRGALCPYVFFPVTVSMRRLQGRPTSPCVRSAPHPGRACASTPATPPVFLLCPLLLAPTCTDHWLPHDRGTTALLAMFPDVTRANFLFDGLAEHRHLELLLLPGCAWLDRRDIVLSSRGTIGMSASTGFGQAYRA